MSDKTEIIYDSKHDRLVYLYKKADKTFWDNQWIRMFEKRKVRKVTLSRTAFITKQYLNKGSAVLEGGCGMSNELASLELAGFWVTGLDYAETTMRLVKKNFPDTKLTTGDVFALPFKNAQGGRYEYCCA